MILVGMSRIVGVLNVNIVFFICIVLLFCVIVSSWIRLVCVCGWIVYLLGCDWLLRCLIWMKL